MCTYFQVSYNFVQKIMLPIERHDTRPKNATPKPFNSMIDDNHNLYNNNQLFICLIISSVPSFLIPLDGYSLLFLQS